MTMNKQLIKLMTSQEKREKLALRDVDMLDDSTLFDLFMDGCTGYNNMDDDEVDQLYKEYENEI